MNMFKTYYLMIWFLLFDLVVLVGMMGLDNFDLQRERLDDMDYRSSF